MQPYQIFNVVLSVLIWPMGYYLGKYLASNGPTKDIPAGPWSRLNAAYDRIEHGFVRFIIGMGCVLVPWQLMNHFFGIPAAFLFFAMVLAGRASWVRRAAKGTP